MCVYIYIDIHEPLTDKLLNNPMKCLLTIVFFLRVYCQYHCQEPVVSKDAQMGLVQSARASKKEKAEPKSKQRQKQHQRRKPGERWR